MHPWDDVLSIGYHDNETGFNMLADVTNEFGMETDGLSNEATDGILLAQAFLADTSESAIVELSGGQVDDPCLGRQDSINGQYSNLQSTGKNVELPDQAPAGAFPSTYSEHVSKPHNQSQFQEPCAPSAEVHYRLKREGVRDFRPIPVAGEKPWKCLAKVAVAPLETWLICLGDIVVVHVQQGKEDYAKVSDMRRLDDGRYVVVYTWLYTREEVATELQVDGSLPEHSQRHLDRRWPADAHYKYILSTNRTITLWDTAIKKVSMDVISKLCYSSIYSTTPSERRIWSVDNRRFKWMKNILLLEPPFSAS